MWGKQLVYRYSPTPIIRHRSSCPTNYCGEKFGEGVSSRKNESRSGRPVTACCCCQGSSSKRQTVRGLFEEVSVPSILLYRIFPDKTNQKSVQMDVPLAKRKGKMCKWMSPLLSGREKDQKLACVQDSSVFHFQLKGSLSYEQDNHRRQDIGLYMGSNS